MFRLLIHGRHAELYGTYLWSMLCCCYCCRLFYRVCSRAKMKTSRVFCLKTKRNNFHFLFSKEPQTKVKSSINLARQKTANERCRTKKTKRRRKIFIILWIFKFRKFRFHLIPPTTASFCSFAFLSSFLRVPRRLIAHVSFQRSKQTNTKMMGNEPGKTSF